MKFLLLAALGAFLSCRENNEIQNVKHDLASKQDSISLLISKLDSLERLRQETVANVDYWSHRLDKNDLAKLKRQGLTNPREELIKDLFSKADLIPYPAVLGGRMQFENASLLNGKWVIASFSDGHIAGEMLLRFEVNTDKGIRWKALDKYLD